MSVFQQLRSASGVGRRAGFTLIELLVAATLTVLIAGVLLRLVTTTLSHWDRSAGALAVETQARGVLDRMEQDLHGAWNREDGNVWLVATIQPDASASGVWVNGSKPVAGSMNPTAPNLVDARFGVAGVWLRFFTTAQLGNPGGQPAPAAISYQIVRRAPTPSGSSASYLLYRSEVTAAATLAAGYDLSAPVYTTATDVSGDPGNVVRPGRLQLLGDDVIDFGVRFFAYVPDPASGENILRKIFPADAADLEYRAQSPGAPDAGNHLFPAVVEVLIRVLTPEGSRQIADLEAGKISGDWWAIATAHSRVFVRRISMQGNQP